MFSAHQSSSAHSSCCLFTPSSRQSRDVVCGNCCKERLRIQDKIKGGQDLIVVTLRPHLCLLRAEVTSRQVQASLCITGTAHVYSSVSSLITNYHPIHKQIFAFDLNKVKTAAISVAVQGMLFLTQLHGEIKYFMDDNQYFLVNSFKCQREFE